VPPPVVRDGVKMDHHPPDKKRGKLEKRTGARKMWLFRGLDLLIWFFLEKILGLFNFHPKSLLLARKGMELTNPTSSNFPMETNAMVSKILAGGLWNYGFYQFHKEFYFPFWAHRQYNPLDTSFIPRSHNLLSINQTNRNWVSISFPGKEEEISMDAAGAIMPGNDAFTIEMAILTENGIERPHDDPTQLNVIIHSSYSMEVNWKNRKILIEDQEDGTLITGSGKGNLIFSIRPFNMENLCFINKLTFDIAELRLYGRREICMKNAPFAFHLSNLAEGDALKKIGKMIKVKKNLFINTEHFQLKKKKWNTGSTSIKDPSGVITAAFFYEEAENIQWKVLPKKRGKLTSWIRTCEPGDNDAAEKVIREWFPRMFRADIPEPYNRILKNMVFHLVTLWDKKDIKPGSFTYHHFWIRDAVMMLYSLLTFGGAPAVRYVLESLPPYVNRRGLFQSQEGEWDSNGQALWIIGQYSVFAKDKSYIQKHRKTIIKMIQWIEETTRKYSGVLPPGFSAEHLGVSDWYLWDNFWALGGLDIFKTHFAREFPEVDIQEIYNKMNDSLSSYLKSYKYYPAALGRKKDAGMIGSIIAVYPLKLEGYFNEKMNNTISIIEKEYFYEKGFYQENIHSGINPYLTLEAAQTFLHLGYYEKSLEIFDSLMRRLSVGDTFPEALHPSTNGGCMGDGFHGWAFAESFLFLRNIFLLEVRDKVIFFAGLPESWLKKNMTLENVHSMLGVLEIKISRNTINVSGIDNPYGMRIYIAVENPDHLAVLKGSKDEYFSIADLGLNMSEDGKNVSKKYVRIIPTGDEFSLKIKSGLFSAK